MIGEGGEGAYSMHVGDKKYVKQMVLENQKGRDFLET
jgi:hypothetical protein